jgi:ubiquinol-cytochrome c reductase core subunit 2
LLSSPADLAINSAHGLAFHHGLGTPLHPTSSSPITKYLDEESIASFASAAYAKSNIAVVANGASNADLSKWVGEFFTETPTGNPRMQISTTPSKYFGGEERISHDGGNVMIIAFPGSSSFTSGSSYKPEVSVLTALLGGVSSIKWSSGFSLLAKAADAFQHAHVATENAAYSDAGLLYVTITGNADHIAKASRSVVETLKKVAAGDVSSEDIKKAVALAKFRALEAGQNIDAGLESTGMGLVSGGKAFQIDEIGASIDKVGDQQVKAVRYLLSKCSWWLLTTELIGCEGTPRIEGYSFNGWGSL